MNKYIIIFSLLIFASCTSGLDKTLNNRIENISKREMQSIDEFLGNDLMEGRAPGTRGANISELYVQSLCKFLDLDPGVDNEKYLQPFSLKGFSTENIELTANGQKFEYLNDIVGVFTEENEDELLDAEAVFVGFGISSDIMDWDDYKDVDVKDKIVITRVNDPGLYTPGIFESDTLTYFGRWTYKIEEAARRGAAGILLIHTDETAGYNWNVVKNSWSGEELFIESDLANSLKFRGWVKESAFAKMLESNNMMLNDLYANTVTKDFKPQDLGFKIQLKGKNSFREVETYNVVANIPGKTDDRIVLSAHIDHLGMSNAEGDNIFNGAIDNGTAVASMMLTAKILKEFQDKLHYSVTILVCNAEESGLLGSKYYAQNTNKDNIIANINFESTPVWEKSNSIMGIGARFSEFEDIIKELAAKENLGYTRFSLGNQGLFYRSDQFSFARYGVPAVWISAGEDEINGERNYTEFWGKDYHTVRDEYNPEWKLDGMKQTIQYALYLVEYLNEVKKAPQWKEKLPFPVEKK